MDEDDDIAYQYYHKEKDLGWNNKNVGYSIIYNFCCKNAKLNLFDACTHSTQQYQFHNYLW